MLKTTTSAKGRFAACNEAQCGSVLYYACRDGLSPSLPQIRGHSQRWVALICETSLNWDPVNIFDGLTKFRPNRIQSYLVYLPLQRAEQTRVMILFARQYTRGLTDLAFANSYVFPKDRLFTLLLQTIGIACVKICSKARELR